MLMPFYKAERRLFVPFCVYVFGYLYHNIHTFACSHFKKKMKEKKDKNDERKGSYLCSTLCPLDFASSESGHPKQLA